MAEDIMLLLITLAVLLFVLVGARWITDRLAEYESPVRNKCRFCRPLRAKKVKHKEEPRIRRIDFPDGTVKEVNKT